MTTPFFDRALPKTNKPKRTEAQTSWREQDDRLDRRERALARAKARGEKR